MLLANYGDTFSDANLPAMIETANASGVTASFPAVRPNYSFHVVSMDGQAVVEGIHDATRSDVWINGEYFVLSSEVLDELGPGEDLVEDPFHHILAKNRLLAQRHDGFWAPMDTLKDKQWLESLHDRGTGPWQVWQAECLLEDDRAIPISG
jgi:glucose-1-phosphate cytidylyltransferase